MKIMRLLGALIVMMLLVGLVSGVAFAGFPPQPTNRPSSGGGGGGSISYSAPVFQAYTDPLKSSDGSVIGRFEGKDFNSVMVWAEKNGTVGNTSYILTIEGELYSEPSGNCWLDISFLEPASAQVPPGMDDGLILGVMNVTKNPKDWSYKGGSPKYTLKISGLNISVSPDGPYYLVRSDGVNYHLLKISIDVSGGQATIKFNPPWDTGAFTIMRAPIATPTPTPTPEPTPTPLPANNGIWGFPIFIAMFALGAIVGASALYLMRR